MNSDLIGFVSKGDGVLKATMGMSYSEIVFQVAHTSNHEGYDSANEIIHSH